MSRKRKLDAKTGEPLPRPLEALRLDEGLRFGDWSLWRDARFTRDLYLFLIHAVSGCVVHLPTSSNGWVNYQFPGMPDWYIIWSSGTVDRQPRTLSPEQFSSRTPGRELPPGSYRSKDWALWSVGDGLRLAYRTERWMAFSRHSPLWTCDEVKLPGVSEPGGSLTASPPE